MLEQLIKELEELKEYKNKYECAIKDKQKMSEKLYEYMLKEYESTTKEERILHYKENTCKHCKYKSECNFWLPDNIGEPVPSEDAWFPATRGCGEFEWAKEVIQMSKMTDKDTIKEKIKAIYPHIVVGGDIDKPCYTIHWYDIEQKTMICGFGSYKLELVRKWLEEEFEVVERDIDGLLYRQQAEIERLKEKYDRTMTSLKAVLDERADHTEAIKEFADKLKATPMRFSVEYVKYYDKPPIKKMVLFIDDNDIDNLAKEMVGEGK